MSLLFFPSLLLTLLLVLHSLRVRGARTTLYFFVSSFLFGVIRGNSVAALAAGENNGPYIFSTATASIGRAQIPACVGWVFALYLSWCLAEAVVSRKPSLSGKVFPLAAFALLAMGCFSCAVETTASSVGWWRWNIIRPSTPFLVGGTHLFGIVEWMSVAFDFLLPFLLFRTQRGWRLPAAWVSLLLYPIHWVTHWKQVTAPGYPHAYEIYHALIALSVPVFLLLRSPRLAPDPARRVPGWTRGLPWAAVAGMFLVLGWTDAAVLREPELLLSLLPLASLLALALGSTTRGGGLAAAAVVLTVLISLLNGRSPEVALARTVPVLIPLACVLAAEERTGLLTRAIPRRLFAGGLVLLAAATAAGMVRGKREREAYSLLMDRARTLVRLGDALGAESLLKRAVAMKPNLNLGRTYLANLYAGQGRYDEAWAMVQRSLKKDPTDQEVYRLAGGILRARGECPGAIPYYQRALLLNPSDTEAARGLGDCYLKTDRFTGAIDVLRKALAREPEDAGLRHQLGEALVRTRRFAQAEKVVRRSLELNPGDAGSHLLMAMIRAGLGDAPGARRECEKVLQIAPGDERARKLLDTLP